MRRRKKLGSFLVVVVALVCVAIGVFGNKVEHIEDTNGADNYALTTITDQQIIDQSMGSKGIRTIVSVFDSKVEISADKFTGVYEIGSVNYIGFGDLQLDLYEFEVTAGNLKLCFVQDDKIVEVIEPGDLIECHLEDVSGTTRLIIAGESAAFQLKISKMDYEALGNDVDG